MPSPASAFCEGVNVLLARTEKIQKVHTRVFAGLADAEEDQVFLNAFRCGQPFNDASEPCESLDCVFSVVVIPRDAIVVEKCEKFVAVFFKTMFALRRWLSLALILSQLPPVAWSHLLHPIHFLPKMDWSKPVKAQIYS